MSIKKIWGTRSKSIDAATYVGEPGTLFYNETDGELRLSNGTTAGGVAISVRADLITAQRLTPAEDNNNAYGLGDETHRWYDLHIGDGGIYYNGVDDPQLVPYIPGALVADLVPATDNDINLGDTDKRFANIYLGYDGLYLADQTTDANINITVDNGTLYIDGAQNLALGNLVIEDTTLKSLTTNLDINIGETNDTGFFYVRRKAQFDNDTYGATEAMVSINASGGTDPETNFPDTLVQLTSRPGKTSRLIQRAYGANSETAGDNSYAVWGSYAARGTVDAPLALKAGDILARLSANGYGKTGGTGVWGSGGTRIESVALENFTATAKGSKINFYTTPIGQLTSQNVASITSTGMSAQAMAFQSDIDLNNGKTQTKAGIQWDEKGANSGVATLDSNGYLTAAQIPPSLTGAVVFNGGWNANTNQTVIGSYALGDGLPSGVAAGWEYIVTVGGTRDIGNGSETFSIGDFVIYDGTNWNLIASTSNFTYATTLSGSHITINGNQATQEVGIITLAVDATSSSTNSTIVSRNSSGNFSANIITAALNGNADTATTATSAGKSTNLVGGNGTTLLGSVPYQSAADTTTLLAPNTTVTRKFFRQTGDGTNGGVPVWDTVTKTDVGLSAVENTALSTSTHYIGTTSITYNRASASQSLTGVSIDGAAGSVAAANITGTTLASNVVTSSLTTVGTLGSLTVTNLVSAKTYSGLARDAGTLGAAGTLTIDFATDHNVLVTLTTTATIAFSNITAGKTVTVLVKNATGQNRAVNTGVVVGNTSGGNEIPTVNDGRTGVFVYRSFGTASTDVYCEVNP